MPYKQCELRNFINDVVVSATSYIDSSIAKVGKFIEVKEHDKWNTWQIISVSETELNDDQGSKMLKLQHALATQDLSLKHRKKSEGNKHYSESGDNNSLYDY